MTLKEQAIEALIGMQTACDGMMKMTKEERDYILAEVVGFARQVQADTYEDAAKLITERAEGSHTREYAAREIRARAAEKAQLPVESFRKEDK